ncbi:MAG TPA: hypothetical protein VEL51_23615 [Vicinamibacterales bacterium]|nr:hypothetical protein [Vicinamibacterales bacterium]
MATFNYTVDDEPQSTGAHVLTPVQILGAANIDSSSHYLVQLEGQHQVSYQEKPNEEIHMHDHMKFISISTGPTPVS